MSDVIYSQEAGRFVNGEMQRFAEIIHDYDPYLSLNWIPPESRTSEDILPYAIVHSPPGKAQYTVMNFKEDANLADILARLFVGDSKRNNVLEMLEKREAAEQILQKKRHMDELEESADMMHFLMTNRSNNWVNWRDRKTGKTVKLDANRRRVT
jgi:hypothetical protein